MIHHCSKHIPQLYDERFPRNEQLPRQFEAQIIEDHDDLGPGVIIYVNGNIMGDRLTDNSWTGDGYRYHDIFHFAFAAVLGWSPSMRANIRCKRKSNARVDEVEDGARAGLLEELVSITAFMDAKSCGFYTSRRRVSTRATLYIRELTAGLEVSNKTSEDWNEAILKGFDVWRQVIKHGEGRILGNLLNRSLEFRLT